jgi:fibronectin type 3 domain-containing protein
MTAYTAVGKLGTLGLGITLCVMASLVTSNAFAAQITLAWDPNTESDLAGYRIHSGSASGSYTMHIDVHNVTSYTVTGLTDGQSYYFAATAYDSAGNESGYSNQVSYSVPAANGAPSTPAVPKGPASALVNATVSFSTSATDPNGDSLQYR